MNSESKCKLTDDIRLEGVVNAGEGWGGIQRSELRNGHRDDLGAEGCDVHKAAVEAVSVCMEKREKL